MTQTQSRPLTPPTFPGVQFVSPDDAAVTDFLRRHADRLGGTGHRADKMPARHLTNLPPFTRAEAQDERARKYDPLGAERPDTHPLFIRIITDALERRRPNAVIAGGALHFDQLLMEVAQALGIPTMLAAPFETQATLWPAAAQRRWLAQAQRAEVCVCVTPVMDLLKPGATSLRDLSPARMSVSMNVRNDFMVRNSTRMLTLSDGSRGGTANCMQIIEQRRRDYDNLWDDLTLALGLRKLQAGLF